MMVSRSRSLDDETVHGFVEGMWSCFVKIGLRISTHLLGARYKLELGLHERLVRVLGDVAP